MKDINGVRFTLRERWEMVSHDLREDMALYGLRQLVGGIVLFHWDKFTQPVRLSPLGTFIHKSRQYDRLVASHLRTVDAYRETVQLCGELRERLIAEKGFHYNGTYTWDSDPRTQNLREQVDLYRLWHEECRSSYWVELRKNEAWQSFYDWMNDEGRVQEHEVEPS